MMKTRKNVQIVSLALLLKFCLLCLCLSPVLAGLIMEDNGYVRLTFVLPSTLESREVEYYVGRLKSMLNASSGLLFAATRKQAYFKEVRFLVPSAVNISGFSDNEENATWEMFDRNAIHIMNTNSTLGRNYMYTQHSRGCGETGESIYIPTSTLRCTGDQRLAQVFVHHWAHFRYGVFDEFPQEDRKEQPPWYYNGTLCIPTSCFDVHGSNCISKLSDGYCSQTFDVNPDALPVFKESASSLMTDIRLAPNVNAFCDGVIYPHDSLAPTPHNIFCQGKSVWDVIKESADFSDGKKYEGSVPPSFRYVLVKRSKPCYIFLIQNGFPTRDQYDDVDKLITKLPDFTTNHLSNETQIGIVTFTNTSEVLLSLSQLSQVDIMSELQRINTEQTSACLECGIKTAVKMISGSQVSATIVLITREEVLNDDTWKKSVDILKNSTVRLAILSNQLSIANNADFDRHSVESGGGVFPVFLDSHLKQDYMITALISLQNVPHGENGTDYILYYEEILKYAEPMKSSFFVDATQAKVVFTVRCNNTGSIKNLTLNGHPVKLKDSVYRNTTVKKCIQDIWTYEISARRTPNPIKCSILAAVHSNISSENVIRLTGWLSSVKVDDEKDAIVIYGELRQGFLPVLEAAVTATIYPPGGGEPQVIDLYDTGNGDPDMLEDGVYSRYFLNFTTTGRHLVIIKARNNKTEKIPAVDDCEIKQVTSNVNSPEESKYYTNENSSYEYLDTSSSCPRETDTLYHPAVSKNKSVKTYQFTRVVSVGSFVVTKSNLQKRDVYPPNRVTDLQAEADILEVGKDGSVEVQLEWTAPGGDYDNGKASSYEIKSAVSPDSLTSCSFSKNRNYLLAKQEIVPKESNLKERHILRIQNILQDKPLYIGLRAKDNEGNYGAISNIIQIYINQSKSAPTGLSTAKYTSTTPSTDKFILTNTTASPLIIIKEPTMNFKIILCVLGSILGVILIGNIICIISLCRKRRVKKKTNCTSTTQQTLSQSNFIDNSLYSCSSTSRVDIYDHHSFTSLPIENFDQLKNNSRTCEEIKEHRVSLNPSSSSYATISEYGDIRSFHPSTCNLISTESSINSEISSTENNAYDMGYI